jgi:plastocyanin
MRWSERSRSRLEAVLVAAAVLGVGLLVLAIPGSASPAASLPPATAAVTDSFTLYGDASGGWGFAANNTTTPGPHLTIGYGETVQLTLIGADQANHNWFIDYNNDTQADGSEPSSPLFSATNSIVWNFTANDVGTFVYRCRIHPTTMWGLITITAPTRYTLYGSVSNETGWGFNATNISSPGPTLIIEAGTNVTLSLYSADGVPHSWFIDYNNDSVRQTSEPLSPQFGGSGNPNPENYSFTTNVTGTYTYRCGIHNTQMWGMIVILGRGAQAPAAFPIGLIPGIMLVVIGGLLILGAVYQVRATRAARMRK